MSEVCVSLRDAVHKDVLPWLNIIVQRPLSLRLSDEILMKITSKANGRLKTLALMNCLRITDDWLQSVIDTNHHINKLYKPGCTGLTPEVVIRAVKTLSEQNSLKSLRINGVYNIKREHLETLVAYFQMNLSQEGQQRQQLIPCKYRNSPVFRNDETGAMLDVDVCPKCNDVRMVHECPRETCKRKEELVSTACRGCNLRIPRCEQCGRCTLQSEEMEETICGDTLCSECRLQLPKCNFCSRSYCTQHNNRQYRGF